MRVKHAFFSATKASRGHKRRVRHSYASEQGSLLAWYTQQLHKPEQLLCVLHRHERCRPYLEALRRQEVDLEPCALPARGRKAPKRISLPCTGGECSGCSGVPFKWRGRGKRNQTKQRSSQDFMTGLGPNPVPLVAMRLRPCCRPGRIEDWHRVQGTRSPGRSPGRFLVLHAAACTHKAARSGKRAASGAQGRTQ